MLEIYVLISTLMGIIAMQYLHYHNKGVIKKVKNKDRHHAANQHYEWTWLKRDGLWSRYAFTEDPLDDAASRAKKNKSDLDPPDISKRTTDIHL